MTTRSEQIIVLISSDSEWRIVKNALPRIKESKTPYGERLIARLGQRELTFFHGGWGKISAAASTQYAIDCLNPKLLVNIGTCGSFHKSMRRGDVILANKTLVYDIIEQMGSPEEAINAYSTEIDISWAQNFESVHRGVLISADRDIIQDDVQGLRRKYNAVAADWESGAIAWVAKKNDIPVLILRGVSDIVSATESLAYGDLNHFEEGADMVMKRLLDILPEFLDIWEGQPR
jgi:adenosylhomocysteine nucleosidase